MSSFIIQPNGGVFNITDFLKNNTISLHDEKAIDALMDAIGSARCVLLGEASHGTHEYYTWRTELSKRLIEEKGFSFIAVEGDWPDCYRVNRYIKHYPESGESAHEVLHAFNRWPTWMWANWEVVALAEWLYAHNRNLPANKKVGFYGLDVYSLWESLASIINYLEKVDPAAAETAKKAWVCFEPYIEEGSDYARATVDQWVPASCETEVMDMLKEVLYKMPQYNTDHEAVMNTGQNAHVAVNAERYYRAMIQSGPGSWNIRDTHMMETLERLMEFHEPAGKAIVWEHNTHIGDARATSMRQYGMVNVGQLVRERYGVKNVFTIGFSSYEGHVIAGHKWDDVMRSMPVPPAKPGSWEHLLHQAGRYDRLMLMTPEVMKVLGDREFEHRAIGVVYHPDNEVGNYVPSLMPRRYDAFLYLDETSALHPLHIQPDGHQIPETFPFGV
ncbi:MAG: erythromycin esterase family protein [Saprospiraceae bacterium]|nr:erythromycin esterase family protein [Saprospiraceae bacterium]MCF8250503.1 erythromycin esterase family protein [Saprospiraceae bacterium]MCF8279643.1 erythromycin esterase family protein [Bacteroidales bacterium]MCF8312429.1 erythromycin esterase family protein [Saprospiraceae bacterium]MCF8440754.1 erythromycin esterase family protein [Saprospiraceae bacterium]